jgi:hypothetical protein
MNHLDRSSLIVNDPKEGGAAPVAEKREDASQPDADRGSLAAGRSIALRLPVVYWIVLTPVFGVISVVEGWNQFVTRSDRLGLVARLTSIWCALLLAIYLLYNSGVQGVMNANASSLAMTILLALGTFVAGVQARVWQICVIGGVLFVAVPGLGWLDQSPLLLLGVACLIIALGGLVWWFTHSDKSHAPSAKPSL